MKERMVATCFGVMAVVLGCRAHAIASDASSKRGETDAEVDAAPEEVRERYDAAGRLVLQQKVRQRTIVAETTYKYDAVGRPIEKKTLEGGKTTFQTWTYLSSGKVSREEIWIDGRLQNRSSYLYLRGNLASKTVESDAESPTTTTFTYDPYGKQLLAETRNADGEVISRVVSVRERPFVPIKAALDAGFDYQSDVDTANLVVGFDVVRKPELEVYGGDPLEVRAAGSYKRSVAAGALTNNYLAGQFGIDYNYLFPRTTLFLFTALERNTVANLNVDLTIAPVGVKFDLVPRYPFLLDLSFAPVWNYRSIVSPIDVAEGDVCNGVTFTEAGTCNAEVSTSTFRGSFRLKAAYTSPTVTVGNVVEFLPDLSPASGTLRAALGTSSIFRNTFALQVKLSSAIALKEELRFTRDLSLAEQVDCSADASSSLCRGQVFATTTTLSFKFDLRR